MPEELTLRPQDTIFVAINPGLENFVEISTKFEVVTAFEYIFHAAHERNIPVIPCKRMSPLDFEKGLNTKHITSFDAEFTARYKEVLSVIKEPFISYTGMDAFSSHALTEAVKTTARPTLCIFGTPIEVDVLASVFGAIRLGWKPYLISDASSSVSERIFYESVDIMSRIARIIDSRDLMKTWGDIS